MKRILLLALAISALVLPSLRQAAAGTDVSIDFFYDNLGDNGSWVEAGDYGYCWQPNVAASNRDWRPYTDGYWAYTDVGWTWVSYEDFGWATYHYGRWAQLEDYGWVWVPGTEWGPAWVSWRTGGDYVGWAPLPPRSGRGGEPIYEGRGISGQVDIEFNIGPSYYNFVDVRYIGEPVLRDRIFEPTRNVTYINQTVNVTNITYNDNRVQVYGPDYDRLSRYSTRPIQRLTLERETNLDPRAALQAGKMSRVQGNRLMIAAPQRIERAPQSAAPRKLKTKLEQPKLETGWSGMADQQAKAQLTEKMKKEDRKNVAPPTFQPGEKPPAMAEKPEGAGAPAQADANASAAPQPNGKGKNRQQLPPADRADRGERGVQADAPVPGTAGSPAMQRIPGRKAGDKRAARSEQPSSTPNETDAPIAPKADKPAKPRANAASEIMQRNDRKGGTRASEIQSEPPQTPPQVERSEPQAAPAPDRAERPPKREKPNRVRELTPAPERAPQATALPAQPEAAPRNLERPINRGGGRPDRAPQPEAAPRPERAPQMEAAPRPQRAPQAEAPRAAQPPREAPAPREGKERKPKKGEQPAQPATPEQ